MPDLFVTPNGVAAANSSTSTTSGLAAGTVMAGQVVYLDTNGLLHPASGTVQAQAQAVVGIALDSALGSAEPLTYATAGDVLLPTSGTVLTAGSTYVLSPNPGNIASANDTPPGTASFITLLGVATNAATLRLSIAPLGAVR